VTTTRASRKRARAAPGFRHLGLAVADRGESATPPRARNLSGWLRLFACRARSAYGACSTDDLWKFRPCTFNAVADHKLQSKIRRPPEVPEAHPGVHRRRHTRQLPHSGDLSLLPGLHNEGSVHRLPFVDRISHDADVVIAWRFALRCSIPRRMRKSHEAQLTRPLQTRKRVPVHDFVPNIDSAIRMERDPRAGRQPISRYLLRVGILNCHLAPGYPPRQEPSLTRLPEQQADIDITIARHPQPEDRSPCAIIVNGEPDPVTRLRWLTNDYAHRRHQG